MGGSDFICVVVRFPNTIKTLGAYEPNRLPSAPMSSLKLSGEACEKEFVLEHRGLPRQGLSGFLSKKGL